MRLSELEAHRNLFVDFVAMNDESGNVPWSSPEAMASIIANQPYLLGEYTPMLITNALDNPCVTGDALGSGKIGRVRNTLVYPLLKR